MYNLFDPKIVFGVGIGVLIWAYVTYYTYHRNTNRKPGGTLYDARVKHILPTKRIVYFEGILLGCMVLVMIYSIFIAKPNMFAIFASELPITLSLIIDISCMVYVCYKYQNEM